MISLRRRFVVTESSIPANAWESDSDCGPNADDLVGKAAIKQLIMERFDIYAEKNGVGAPVDETATSNGHKEEKATAPVPSPPPSSSPMKRDADSEEASAVGSEPPAKKYKPDADVDADALYAAKLQAEENMRARPTRGGNSRRAAPSKKKSKAKTSKRVKAEDDSDVESGSDAKKEVNRSGGFHVSVLVCFGITQY